MSDQSNQPQTNNTIYQETTKKILNEFRETDFKSEIIPVDSENFHILFKDPVFWIVATLGVLPLLITSLQDLRMQLIGMLFFFALMWGGVFRGLVLKNKESITLPVLAFFFTGAVGIPILLFSYQYMPKFYFELPDSNHFLYRLIGSIFQTGLCEELCKILPVILYLLYKRKQASPYMILLIGIFSGLGFAAFENIGYSNENIVSALESGLTGQKNSGVEGFIGGIATGVTLAMTNVMLRSISLVFAHAIWTAIFSYYLTMAFVSGKRWFVLCFLGLAVPAVLHGVYNWFCVLQPVFAASIIACSFILFYGYLSKLRQHIEEQAE